MPRLLLALAVALSVWPPAVWAGLKSAPLSPSGRSPAVAGLALPALPPGLPAPGLPSAAAHVPMSAAPAPSLVPTLAERLAEPLGAWASPESEGGKPQAAADFERRAFGSPERAQTPVEPPPSGGGEDEDRLPPPSGGPQIVVLVRVADDAAREKTMARLASEYAFKRDHGFSPLSNGASITFRGLIPISQIGPLSSDPEVLAFGPAVGRVENVSLEPYVEPTQRENAFRWALRGLWRKSETAGILALAPFAVGTTLVFGPFVALATLPAAPLFSAVAFAAGAANLLQLSPLQKLFPRVPLAARFAVAPALQAVGGVILLTQGAPLLGAWAVFNGVLGATVASRVFGRLEKRGRAGHSLERTLDQTEASAVVTGLSAGLTGLAASSVAGPWAAALSLASSAALTLLALPGPRPKPAPTPAAAEPETLPQARLAAFYGRALAGVRAAEKRRGRALYAAAAAMVLAPLSLAGAMKAVAWGWIGMTPMTAVYYALLAFIAAGAINWGVALARLARARERLSAASADVVRAAGAREPLEMRQSLLDAEEFFGAIAAVERLQPKLAALTAALRRDEKSLSLPEARALAALEALLSGREVPRAATALAALLGSEGRTAISARRRLLWDDASVTPVRASSEDESLGAMAREFAGAPGPDDPQNEMNLIAGRLDRLYARPGAFDERHLALALSAVTQMRWAEYGRGRNEAGRGLMGLEKMLRRQARDADAEPEERREHALAAINDVIAGFTADPAPF